jgi:hypothetical protein
MIDVIAKTFTTGCTLFGAVYGLFEILRRGLSAADRKALLDWMARVDRSKRPSTLREIVPATFDQLFGARHLSLFCLWRSTILALTLYFTLLVCWALFHTNEFLRALRGNELRVMFVTAPLVAALLSYVILASKRLLLGAWLHSGRTSALPIWVTADVLVTAFFVTYVAGVTFSVLGQVIEIHTLTLAYAILGGPLQYIALTIDYGLTLESRGGWSVGVLFYSTLLTAVWPSVFMLGAALTRCGARGLALMSRLESRAASREKPFGLTGVLTGAGVAAAYWLFSLGGWLGGWLFK